MIRKVIYVSELGRTYDTPEDAISDDKRLPQIIAVYEKDLARMEAGLKTFGCGPVTEELKQQWRKTITDYKTKWEKAQLSFENAEVRHGASDTDLD